MQLYYRHVYPWFGLPQRLISDRDPQFTSHFGKALAKELGITWNLSMVYHPQMDGLTERKNQWVEQYLCLVTTNQDDWSMMLPLATLVHNNIRNGTTGFAPNDLLIGREPPATLAQGKGTENPLVEQWVTQLRQWRILATRALNNAADKARPTEAKWSVGQKVWLEAKNLALPYGTVKLAPRHHGPFKITKVLSPIMYRLELPFQ